MSHLPLLCSIDRPPTMDQSDHRNCRHQIRASSVSLVWLQMPRLRPPTPESRRRNGSPRLPESDLRRFVCPPAQVLALGRRFCLGSLFIASLDPCRTDWRAPEEDVRARHKAPCYYRQGRLVGTHYSLCKRVAILRSPTRPGKPVPGLGPTCHLGSCRPLVWHHTQKGGEKVLA